MIRGRIASFGYAFEGLAVMIRTQPNAWIHSVATLAVVAAGAVLLASASAVVIGALVFLP